ncbi:MAG: hypothetical protein ABSB35_27635 [Bryobacteraceae bacterium]|jgi:hypothetical protein
MSLIHSCELARANASDYLSQLQRHTAEKAANPAADERHRPSSEGSFGR